MGGKGRGGGRRRRRGKGRGGEEEEEMKRVKRKEVLCHFKGELLTDVNVSLQVSRLLEAKYTVNCISNLSDSITRI